jgi:hypothetical protein
MDGDKIPGILNDSGVFINGEKVQLCKGKAFRAEATISEYAGVYRFGIDFCVGGARVGAGGHGFLPSERSPVHTSYDACLMAAKRRTIDLMRERIQERYPTVAAMYRKAIKAIGKQKQLTLF